MNGTQESARLSSALIVNHRTGALLQSPRRRANRLSVIWLYGLFDHSRICHYVGQTRFPKQRAASHLHSLQGNDWRKKRELQFRVIRQCPMAKANRLEVQIIKGFKRREQCELNNSFLRFTQRKYPARFYSQTADKFFSSVAEAAAYFDCSTTTIWNHVKGIKPNCNKLISLR